MKAKKGKGGSTSWIMLDHVGFKRDIVLPTCSDADIGLFQLLQVRRKRSAPFQSCSQLG